MRRRTQPPEKVVNHYWLVELFAAGQAVGTYVTAVVEDDCDVSGDAWAAARFTKDEAQALAQRLPERAGVAWHAVLHGFLELEDK